MNAYSLVLGVVSVPFRRRRMRRFAEKLSPTPTTRILDIGGKHDIWQSTDTDGDVVILNLHHPRIKDPDFTYEIGDATQMRYADNTFDIAFSNSCIEHVHTYENQKKFASEMCRVGKSVWCQTPAKGFFIEPHFITPFIHLLPKSWLKKVLRNFSVWGWVTRPTQEQVNDFVDEIRLLTLKEMKELFPDCKILVERFLFMPKSYIAVRL